MHTIKYNLAMHTMLHIRTPIVNIDLLVRQTDTGLSGVRREGVAITHSVPAVHLCTGRLLISVQYRF